ncbi:MAG: S8 family serine peptidase [Candidatus Bathyarchaeota archaeon]|nr:MAG: S8 family serine peptidase [Candidatus Bathyarchaeota archaeon]
MRTVSIVSVLLFVVLAFAIFPFAYTEKPNIETMKEAPGYVIEFKGNKLPKNAEAIIEECGGTPTSMLPELAVAAAMPNGDSAAFEQALAENDAIKCFDHDYITEVPDSLTIPVAEELVEVENGPDFIDPYYWTYQWHLWHTIEASPTGAWLYTTGSPDVSVAVLDTGIDYNHGDIIPNYDFVLSRSFVPENLSTPQLESDPMDYESHGTWCGGLVAAAVNDNPDDWKCIGVGPTLNLVNLKVMDYTGSGYFSWVFEAVYYAVANDIDVISMSLGGYLPRGVARSFQSICNKVFNYAESNGIICVGSAGNQGWDMDWVHAYYVHVPSQCSGVIDVIGTDIYDDIAHTAWGSNYGSSLHGIAAPGGDYAFVKPEWYPPITWQFWYGLCFSTHAWTTTGFRYSWKGGTSMAAPHVAGVAGLILSVNPDLSPAQVRHFLFQGAEDLGMPGYDEYYNFGRLNAFNSLEAVQNSRIRGAVVW